MKEENILNKIKEIQVLIDSKINFKEFLLIINKEYYDYIKNCLNSNIETIITSNFPDNTYIAALIDKNSLDWKGMIRNE